MWVEDPKQPGTAWGGDQARMLAGTGITLALDPQDGAVFWQDRATSAIIGAD